MRFKYLYRWNNKFGIPNLAFYYPLDDASLDGIYFNKVYGDLIEYQKFDFNVLPDQQPFT